MAVQNLHDAAKVLEGVYQAIERLLVETEPMERDVNQQVYSGRAWSDTELDALWSSTGYGPFADMASKLIGILEEIDRREQEEADRTFAA